MILPTAPEALQRLIRAHARPLVLLCSSLFLVTVLGVGSPWDAVSAQEASPVDAFLRPPVQGPPAPPPQMVAPVPEGRRVINLKFEDDLGVSLGMDGAETFSSAGSSQWAEAVAGCGLTDVRPLFTLPRETLTKLRREGEARTGEPLPDMSAWFRLEMAAPTDEGAAEDHLRRCGALLGELEGVAHVEFVHDATPPPAITPDFTAMQGYLTAATDGIDAQFAWGFAGGNGSGVQIIDVEYDWNQNHEDLTKAAGVMRLLPAGEVTNSPFSNDHGTAVLSEMIADNDTKGVTGAVWGADIGLAPERTDISGSQRANAIMLATAASGPGDVILLEMQTRACAMTGCDSMTQANCGPAEEAMSVFNATQTATAAGIVVVAAAGNGSVNLDSAACGGRYDGTMRPHSGAIIVGAGAPPGITDRQRLGFSTFGSRVDLQGWGGSVATAGYGTGYFDPDAPADTNKWYRFNFSGTSSASPIVASAAAAIQGMSMQLGSGPLSPAEVRDLLVQTGSPQLGDLSTNIGPRPDLRQAIAQLFEIDLRVDMRAVGKGQPFDGGGAADGQGDVDADAETASVAQLPGVVIAGEELLFEVDVFNRSGITATNTIATVTLPLQAMYLGDTDNCSVTGTDPVGGGEVLTCLLGDLGPFEGIDFLIKTRIDPAAVRAIPTGTLAIEAEVSVVADQGDADFSDNIDDDGCLIQDAADLKITKFASPHTGVRAGEQFTYTILVDNLGPSTARNVVVTDTLITSSLVEVNGCSIFVRTEGGAINEFDCTFGVSTGLFDLATMGSNWLNPRSPTDEGRIEITINATALGDVDMTNVATVTADTPDPNPANNMAMATLSVSAVADLQITKTDLADPVFAGDTLIYAIEVSNLGPSPATNVIVEDLLPAEVEVLSVNGATCTIGTPGDPTDPLRCSLGTVAPSGGQGPPPVQIFVEVRVRPDAVVDPRQRPADDLQ